MVHAVLKVERELITKRFLENLKGTELSRDLVVLSKWMAVNCVWKVCIGSHGLG